MQLDTKFPRIPGDVSCQKTFIAKINVVKIRKAFVNNIVLKIPQKTQFLKFKSEVSKSNEKIITTSCGFTFYWQDKLSKLSSSYIITSSLCSLDLKRKFYKDKEILILTFDAKNLRPMINLNLVKPFKGYILGLEKQHLLYKTIINDEKYFCSYTVQKEMNYFLKNFLKDKDIKLIILECTNMVPYKNSFRSFFHGEIIDILSLIEEKLPGSVNSKFL